MEIDGVVHTRFLGSRRVVLGRGDKPPGARRMVVADRHGRVPGLLRLRHRWTRHPAHAGREDSIRGALRLERGRPDAPR